MAIKENVDISFRFFTVFMAELGKITQLLSLVIRKQGVKSRSLT
jgi:hypothetical protein